jgi:hypothetical protein
MKERRKDDGRIATIETKTENIEKIVDRIEEAITGKNGLVVQTNSNKWRVRGALAWCGALTTGLYLIAKSMGIF